MVREYPEVRALSAASPLQRNTPKHGGQTLFSEHETVDDLDRVFHLTVHSDARPFNLQKIAS